MAAPAKGGKGRGCGRGCGCGCGCKRGCGRYGQGRRSGNNEKDRQGWRGGQVIGRVVMDWRRWQRRQSTEGKDVVMSVGVVEIGEPGEVGSLSAE